MIVTPEEMTFAEKTFSVILYGSPGVGKTTLALSAPDPILIDFDRGISRVKAQHRKTTIVCRSYEEVLEDIKSPVVQTAKSIVIDTGGSFVTFLQDWAMRQSPSNRQKNGKISQQGFGAVKAEFNRFTSMVRDVMGKNLIYVFHSEEKMDRDGNAQQRLMCEGSAKNIVWTPADFGGYIQMIGDQRVICFTPEQEYFAKGCHGIHGRIPVPELKSTEPNDFLTRLFDTARKNISDEAEAYAPVKAQYDDTMTLVRDMIEHITDAASANEVLSAIPDLPHALTSLKEAKALLTAKTGSLGLVYSVKSKGYIKAEVRPNA